jgi:putative IMPACT (imprinted ancient) family translation regulator
VVIDYSSVTPVQRMLPDYETKVLDEQYAADVTYHLEMPVENVERFTADLNELTSGQALVEPVTGSRHE